MKKIIIFLIAFTLSACSLFKPSEKEEKYTKVETTSDEVYVFDDVADSKEKEEEIKSLENKIDRTLEEKKAKNKIEYEAKKAETNNNRTVDRNISYETKTFYLQLGAFSTLNKAEQHVENIRSQVPFQLSIIYSKKTNFYTVRSTPYQTRQEVENIKESLWKKNLFKDSFIVTD